LRPGFEPRPYIVSTPSQKRLLILGGSQGAQALNEVLPRAIGRLLANGPPFTVMHQAGRDRDAAVREAYAKSVSKEEVASYIEVAPFLDDVADRMASADLIIARSGAVTVAEVSAIGRAAIFVPFPHAADDHQAKNALALADL